MAKNFFIVFDTETGGLKPDKNPIMELAAIVKSSEWKEEARFETLVKNYNDLQYDHAALDIHGISVSECQNNGMELTEFVDTMIKLFKKFTPKGDRGGGKPILAGHNVAFDISMLKTAFSIAGKNLNEYVLSNNGEIIVYDTLPTSKLMYPNAPNYKLGELCKMVGLGDFVAHRAMPDVVITCEFIELMLSGKQDVKETKQSGKSAPVRQIIESNHVIKYQF